MQITQLQSAIDGGEAEHFRDSHSHHSSKPAISRWAACLGTVTSVRLMAQYMLGSTLRCPSGQDTAHWP
jgi:hypothetical protein